MRATRPGPAPRLRVAAVVAHERPFALRLPFRFGSHTLVAATQAVVTVRVEFESGGSAVGHSAEVLLPKWFDKRAHLTPTQNEEQLRGSLRRAAAAYRGAGAATAFDLFASTHNGLVAEAAELDDPDLVADFGPALLDRAVLDALCRHLGCSVMTAINANLPGIGAHAVIPDLAGLDWTALLASLRPATVLHARHTVGWLDPLSEANALADGPADGLPVSLSQVVHRYGNTHFKLKLSGDPVCDIERLRAIASLLDELLPAYRATLDGNEQYADGESLRELWARLVGDSALARLRRSLLLIEQPLARGAAFEMPVDGIFDDIPVIVDESDGPLDAFLRARALGYRGVSSKSCKGLYRSLVNAARCATWNAEEGVDRYLLSAEDLAIQAGLSQQQDLALAAALGLGHIERNGHHYVAGFATCGADEAGDFRDAHPDVYADAPASLRVEAGRISVGSVLAARGLGTEVSPRTGGDRSMTGFG